jgi:uncharacterized protein YjiS (DUF1127 family)
MNDGVRCPRDGGQNESEDTVTPSHDRVATTVLALLRRIKSVLALWRERRRVRAELRGLLLVDDHILQDIGLTRSEISSEVSKPFWR